MATVAVHVDADQVDVLCLRRGSVITAFGRGTLPAGTARNGRILIPGPVIEALDGLRDALRLPAASRVVMLIQPMAVRLVGGAVVAAVDAEDATARRRVVDQAGLGPARLDPVPAALARLAGQGVPPVRAEGWGWRTRRDGPRLEIGRKRDRSGNGVAAAGAPDERAVLTAPIPVAVDPGIVLLPVWPLLVGAALSTDGALPIGRIEEVEPPPSVGWAVERIGGPNREEIDR